MNHLEIKDLSKNFGGLKAVVNLSCQIERGRVTGLIGPNGSGKTTTLNMISGFLNPSSGQIFFDGKDISGAKMSTINRLGIARTFQQIRLFPQLTCFQNVMVARHYKDLEPWWRPILFPGRNEILAKSSRAKVLEMLDFVGIYNLREIQAKNLSYGDQRKLEIARALATEPEILLLDEPVAGMNPTEAESIVAILRTLRERGLSTILVEHSMNVVMNICDRIIALDMGSMIAEGSPAEILMNQHVIDAYLGKRRVLCNDKN
jgi:branched-chain amino acid transport system ATP-binding protein